MRNPKAKRGFHKLQESLLHPVVKSIITGPTDGDRLKTVTDIRRIIRME